jgi:DinB family protein
MVMAGSGQTALRTQIAKLLDWEEAHAGFDKTVKGFPPRLRGVVPERLPYSAWQLIEHLRIGQADILDFCRNPRYEAKNWPDDYWPSAPRPAAAAAWTRSIAAFTRDRRSLQRLAMNPKIDLFGRIPHGTGQTYLRELLLIADHTAYHVGQIVVVRRALGIWR